MAPPICSEPTDMTEEQWREIDQTKSAHAGYKRKPAAKAEVEVRKCAQINDRTGIGQAADDEAGAGKHGSPSTHSDGVVGKPLPARSPFKDIVQTAKTERHQD